MNEKRHMFIIKKDDVIMFAYCNNNNKNKQFVKSDFDDFDFINREIYVFCKVVDRKFKYLFIKC